VRDDRVQGLDPLLGLRGVEGGPRCAEPLLVGREVAGVLMHEGKRRRELGHLPPEALRKLAVGHDARAVHVEVLEEAGALVVAHRQAGCLHRDFELSRVDALGDVVVGTGEPLR